jgi:hypothetical protein
MNTHSGTALYSPIAILRNDLPGNSLTLFPNPVQDYLTVKSNANMAFIRIISTSGKLMKQYQHPVRQNGMVLLNMQDIPTGLYIVQVQQEGGALEQMKILKQ